MERRAVLGGVGAVLLSALAGCAGSSGGSGTESFDPKDHVGDWQDEPAQGEADPIETVETVESYGDIEVKCGTIGRDALRLVVLDRLEGTTSLAFSFGRNRVDNGETDEEDEYVLSVYREITVGRDGDAQLEPEVPFSELQAVTPREVHTTVRRDGTEIHSCRYEVYIQDQVVYAD